MVASRRSSKSTEQTSRRNSSTAAAAPSNTADNPQSSSKSQEEELVLSYLRKHGLNEAASSLSELLQKDVKQGDGSAKKKSKVVTTAVTTAEATLPPTSTEGNPSSIKEEHAVTTGSGYDLDSAPSIALWGVGGPTKLLNNGVNVIRDEAREYVEGFTSLITWILNYLGDDPANVQVEEGLGGVHNGHQSSKDMVLQKETTSCPTEDDVIMQDSDKKETKGEHDAPNQGLSTLIQHALGSNRPTKATLPTLSPHQTSIIPENNTLITPPSTKPELLSLSFPLMVHTYCELLSNSMEQTARAFLSTYRHLYQSFHPDAMAEMEKCHSTSILLELNEAVMNQNSIQGVMRSIQAQKKSGVQKREELVTSMMNMQQKDGNIANNEEDKGEKEDGNKNSSSNKPTEKNLAKMDGTLSKLNQRLSELMSKNSQLQCRVSKFPFLRRVRSLKWNVTISISTYRALEIYANSTNKSVVITALLMNRCHLIVERRDPMPYCPTVILDDVMDSSTGTTSDSKDVVRWAAPMHPAARAMEAGEDETKSILIPSQSLPFPTFKLEDGDDNDDQTKAAVEFNRALLVSGFRRLEALELKKSYESYGANTQNESNYAANPLSPSVLLGSLCCATEADAGGGTPWTESHVGITSASICPPDGRKVAVGCDDAAVRIWSLDRPSKGSSRGGSSSSGSALGEPSLVLLGHKNGFPVFDVDWTRNGRTLLSAGGDGSIRLWDSEAVGPIGKLSNVSVQKNSSEFTNTSLSGAVNVPGSKAESLVEISGAALSVYRGHAPSTPVWSVASAPSGYYFASAGSDYTARIWCTDRCSPLRVLSGHISPSVNCVTWHPNCNYVLTASDDKTCRMWDIQSGKCVRILSGSFRGLNLVRVSPSGRYAAGAGYDNIVRIWDLGNGRLVNELRPTESQESSFSDGIINSLCYSSCGSALAVAGEDCTVKIWDVRGAANHLSNPDYFASSKGPNTISSGGTPVNRKLRPGARTPTGMFRTNNISILDLQYTKRNLLLAVGNYAA